MEPIKLSDPINFLSKLCVIGDAAVGKSSLILKYTSDSFQEDYISTIGAQFSTYEYITQGDVHNSSVHIRINASKLVNEQIIFTHDTLARNNRR